MVGNAVENDDDDDDGYSCRMVEVVVVDVDGRPLRTGNGEFPCCPAVVPPGVLRDVAAVGETADAAAAAAQADETWHEVVHVNAVAAAATVAAVAATATICLDVIGDVGRLELLDAKASAGDGVDVSENVEAEPKES